MHRRREYSPSRRTRFYTDDNTPDNRARSYTDVVVDEYGGFARHKRDGPRHSHIKNSNADSGGSTSSKENIHNEDDLILERKIPKCPDLALRGHCGREGCKYDHSEIKTSSTEIVESLKCKVQEVIHNPSLTSKVELLLVYQFCHVSNYFLNLNASTTERPDHYRKWVMAMLELLSTDTNRYFTHLKQNESHCLQLFQTLASAEYMTSVGNDLQSKSRIFSFQRCLIPLLFLLSHSEMGSSPSRHLTNRIYSIFANQLPHFFVGFLACAMECLESYSLDDQHCSFSKALERDVGCFVPCCFAQVYYPFIRFLTILAARFPETLRKSEIKDLMITLENEILKWELAFQDKKLSTIESEFTILLVKKELGPLKDATQEVMNVAAMLLAKRQREKEIQSTIHHSQDLWTDGPLEKPKEAHDNDFSDFKKIRIIPTMQEILYPHLPTLPGNQQSIPYAHWLEPGPLRLLDTHFRLLRQDMFASIQSGLKSLISNLHTIQSTRRYKKSCGYEQVDLMVYTHLQPHKMDFDFDYGSCFSIWYLVPPYAKSTFQLKRFFENCLLRDGLVALVRAPSKECPEAQIYFATVVTKNDSVENIKHGYSTVLLNFAENRSQTAWLKYSREFVMVEVRGLLFEAYRPVLRALQQLEPSDIPFTSILCSATPLKKIDPPCYMRTGQFKCDLNFLKKDVKSEVNLVFNPMEFDSQKITSDLMEHTTLDQSQSNALVSALTQEVCCIQGPPGTGKSYIGIKIMQALCDPVKSTCFPILVLCYTNHALDQFLESLLDEGIKSIVRLGSRVSERLKDYRMNAWGERGFYMEKLKYKERIKDAEESLLRMNVNSRIESSRAFWSFLKFKYPEQTYCIFHFCRTLQATDYIRYWVTGCDLQRTRNQKRAKNKVKNRFSKLLPDTSDEEEDEDERMEEEYFSDSQDAEENKWENLNGVDVLDEYLNLLSVNENEEKAASSSIKKGKRKTSKNPSLSELLQVKNVWSLTIKQREEVHAYWQYLFEETRQGTINRLQVNLDQLLSEFKELKAQFNLKALKSKKVIGMTTTSSAKHLRLIQGVQPKIIICEEAGEILEAHILASLGRYVQHLILIGDHLQLRPHIREYSLNVESSEGKKYRLNESLFERLMHVSEIPKNKLTAQRRMRPLISQFVRAITYPELKDGENTTLYPDVKGVSKNVFFLNHTHPQSSGEESFGGHSHSNLFEIQMIVALTVYFIQQGYKSDQLVILTPYVGQLLKIREALAEKNMTTVVDERDERLLRLSETLEDGTNEGLTFLSNNKVMVEEKNLRSCIRVSSIDNYQGEETDVVLISLVRSTFEDGSEKGIGFLNIENRMNVLLSRARHGMYILGNASLLEGKSKVWNKVIQLLRKQELMGDALPIVCQNHPETIRFISSPGSFAIEAPDGGCLLPCSSRLQKCGHICERHCHSDDKEHLTVKCRKPCLRLHDQCQHPCPKLCFKDCGKCETRVPDIILPGCNHIYPNPKCTEAQSVSKLVCKRILEKNRFCGHSFMIPCHKDINLEPCKRKCNDILKCGHNCNRECSQCLRSNKEEKLHGPCLQPCGQSLACLHTCQVPCDKHESNGCPPCKQKCIHTNCDHGKCKNICSEPCLPCMEKCTWTCEHEPNCPLPCGAPCIRLPCNIRCKKLLSCGHVCPSLCGEPCPSSKYCKECCDDKIKSFPVDMLLFQEYREVNVDETPILVLPCGHFYTYETLDGVFEINKYYHQLGNQFVDVKELPSNDEIRIMACPDCRTPIQAYHVKRYSRILKKAVLLLNDKHYTVMLSKELVNLDASIKSYPQELEKLNENVRARNRLSGDKKRPEDILFRSLQTELVSFISKLKKNPSRKVYNAMLTCFDDFSSVRKRKTNTYNQREIDKLNGALKNTPIVRNYFVEEGKANLLLYQLYSHDFTSQLNEKYTTSSSSLAYASLNVAKVLFEKSNHVFDGAIKHLNLGKAHFRVLEAHIFLFEFTLKYLEYLYKVRMSKSFYFFSSDEQKSLSEIVDEKIEWILPKFETMKHLSQEINKHDYDESFINYMSQFRKLQEGMRQGSTVPPLSELGYIVSALSGTVGTTGHWYSCPNGHLYVIGNCGQAMEVSNCPECGALVGGRHHQLNSTNRREDTLINSALQAYEAG